MKARRLVAFAVAVGAPLASAQPATVPDWCRALPRPGNAALERVDAGDSWFEVYRVRPGVYALSEPRQFEEVISYLVVGSERALLFDTGMGIGRISRAVSRLTRLPVVVLSSHTHYDHIGGNAEFDEVWGADTEFTRENAQGLPNARVRESLDPKALCAPLPPGVTRDGYRIRPFRIARTVRDRERIPLGGRTLEVLAIPGHAPDALALLDREAGLLLTGDTFYEGPIYVFGKGADFQAYARSVERLAALAPSITLLLPAHNVAASAPVFLTRLAEAARAIREGRIAPRTKDGRHEYGFEGFSLLVAPELAGSAPSEIEARVANRLASFRGAMGVSAKHLGSGEAIHVNADTRFPTASVIKTAVMVEVFQQIAEGRLRRDQHLTLTRAAKVGGSGVLRNLADGGQYSIADLLYLIAEGRVVSREASDEMIALLGRQQVREMLPRLLPGEAEGVAVAHKTGHDDEKLPDAGIVTTPKGRYVIAVFARRAADTSWSVDNEAVRAIAEVSRLVFDHFAGR